MPRRCSRTKDFSEFTDAELARAQTMLASMPWHLGVRRTRRWEPARGTAIDLRRLARTQPDARRRAARAAAPAPPRSAAATRVPRRHQWLDGTLQPRASALRVRTRTRRAARRELRVRDAAVARDAIAGRCRTPTRALRASSNGLHDWGGGTRIGDALRAFNMHWARRVMRNGPVVLIVSDGWDRGDPQLLASELARVRRRCRRLIWLNPLLGSASYEPLTRGMQAALGHVDDFLPAHNMASLEDLARHLRSLRAGHAS